MEFCGLDKRPQSKAARKKMLSNINQVCHLCIVHENGKIYNNREVKDIHAKGMFLQKPAQIALLIEETTEECYESQTYTDRKYGIP